MLSLFVLLFAGEAFVAVTASGNCSTVGTSCQRIGECRQHFVYLDAYVQETCFISAQEYGVCCPIDFQSPIVIPLVRSNEELFGGYNVARRRASDNLVREFQGAEIVGKTFVKNMGKLEKWLAREGIIIKRGTSASKHLSLFPLSPRLQALGREALVGGIAVRTIGRSELYNPEESRASFTFAQSQSNLANMCPDPVSCDFNDRYRNLDGTCNNPINPLIGMMGAPFVRIAPPAYADGVMVERQRSVDGSQLKSPRLISSTIATDADRPLDGLSLMVMQWGQFLDHDFARTPVFRGFDGSGVKCCEDDGTTMEGPNRHPQCLPIEIPADDPFYSKFNRRCMEFVRSMPGVRLDCSVGYIDQFNGLTHYIDGSMIYGSNDTEAEELRELKGGRLRVHVEGNKEILPIDESPPEDCSDPPPGAFCFKAGDERVNEQIDLSVMHTLWMREHNRVCEILQYLNPHWDDETTYQEARRVVIAEIQHITYSEWLPIILGKKFVEKYRLLSRSYLYSYQYSPRVDASISNAFATAAFRFGHSLLQGDLELHSQRGIESIIQLKDHFEPYLLYKNGTLDLLTRGLVNQPAQSFDKFFVDDVTNFLFQMNGQFGLDLVSLNIQRGRDHGLPGYNTFRRVCGFKPAQTFDDFRDHINPKYIEVLQSLYKHVDDVDLYIGGVLESPRDGSIIGPVFRCIVGDQFFRLKWGDRFFYDLGDRPHSFTPGQLHEIRKTSLARIICDNADGIKYLQRYVFFSPSSGNPLLSCYGPPGYSFIPAIDFTHWSTKPVVAAVQPVSLGPIVATFAPPEALPTQRPHRRPKPRPRPVHRPASRPHSSPRPRPTERPHPSERPNVTPHPSVRPIYRRPGHRPRPRPVAHPDGPSDRPFGVRRPRPTTSPAFTLNSFFGQQNDIYSLSGHRFFV